VDDIVTVSEQEIERATLLSWEGLKLALEPSGALSLAAYLQGNAPAAGPTALIFSGGNASRPLMARILSREA